MDTLMGKDADKVIRLLAATSPRQPVHLSMVQSLRIWQVWNSMGRPSDPAVD